MVGARVKICGITSREEAAAASRCGADAIGVLVGRIHVAEDFVGLDIARDIVLAAPPFLTTVLVTHLEDAQAIEGIAEAVPCPVVQLHGDLSPERLRELRRRLFPRKIVARVGVDGESAVDRAAALQDCADAIVLDSLDPDAGRIGGTGRVHDWRVSARIVRASRLPVILAGGLNSDNVRDALSVVRPWAVDVNSGVEGPDGRKSEERIRAFVRAVTGVRR